MLEQVRLNRISSIYHNHSSTHAGTNQWQCVGWGREEKGRERETANQVIANQVIAIGTSDSEEGGGSAGWW